MEITNRFGRLSIKNFKSIFKILVTLVFAAALFAFVLWAAQIFFEMFAKAGLAYEALVIFFTLVFLVLVFTSISSTIKVLYYKGDNEILMRFPVSGTEVFCAKTIFLVLSQAAVTILIVVPFLIAYSLVCPMTTSYYVAIPIVVFFMIFVPFFLANVLAIPFMHLSNKIRNKFALIIIVLAVIVTLLFFAYTLVFEKMVLYLRSDKEFSVFNSETIIVIKNVVKYLIPTKYFAGMMVGQFETTQIINRETVTVISGENRLLSYLVFIVIFEVCAIGTFLVIKYLYQKTLLNNVEVEGSAFTKKTSNRPRSIFSTLMHKEFVQVFRSINYSFQYFVLACAMPVMVYFCNRIAIAIGRDDIGYKIIPGLTLLVMMIFNTVIISFSATSVTREGGNFYHTKVMPVSIKTQLAVKFTMYILVSFVANTVTFLIILFTRQMMEDPTLPLDWLTPLLIYVIVTLLSVGITLISMRYDVRRPRFNLNGEGELVNNNSNTTASILLGVLSAVFYGIVGMVTPYFMKQILELIQVGFVLYLPEYEFLPPVFMTDPTMVTPFILCVLACFALLFLVYAVLRYIIKLTKTYNKIV